ncbi:MAG TPA: menaquinone biosynthesis protein [Candidatus Dormibacteraeota bacterium]|jgi:chorismate dehydratase|nr:menaquinone biosynthesis protein [Candidatus Dormibacteraeota bacterium]
MTVDLRPARGTGEVPLRPVRLGRVGYVNVLPVYLGLEREGTRCDVISGVPTELNAQLDSRRIDCAPVSAIEVARHGGSYAFLDGLSISSVGAVGSSMLISKVPPEQLGGRSVALTTHSAASLGFFHILCARLWHVTPRSQDASPDLDAMLQDHDAAVLIGNPALRAVHTAEQRGDLHVVDLGSAWHELTGLPAVFAVWALWRDWAAEQPDAVRMLHEDLDRGRRWGLNPDNRAALVARAAADTELPAADLDAYFDKQDYRLSADHQRSLLRYFALLAELDLAPPLPRLDLI